MTAPRIAPINALNVAFGQGLSVLIASSGIFSKLLETNGASLPAFQSFCSYFLLMVLFNLYRFVKSPKSAFSLRVDIWVYLFLAVVDVQANYLVLLAFRYAHFATVGLLLHLTIPFVTFFSYIILNKRYFWKHYLGSAVALLGSVVIFVSAFENETAEELKGDIMCVGAALLYSISNVVQEWCVSQGGMDSSFEFLAIMSFFATFMTGSQFAMLEVNQIAQIGWTADVIGYLIGYAVAIFSFYSLASVFLRVAESLLFNLSLLTADIFTLIASYVIFKDHVSGYYIAALFLNACGIAIYSIDSPQELTEEAEPVSSDDEKSRYSMVSTPTPRQYEDASPSQA